MELFFGILLGIVMIILLVIVHELGHAYAAKQSGVKVEEFGIGFPPRAWQRKLKGGTIFSLNWLPLGGFVKLQGEHDSAKGKGDYGAASFGKKTKILFAGVIANWGFAAILLTFLALVGMPKILPNQFSIPNDTKVINQPVEIEAVKRNYPAQKAGLKSGDQIVRFAGQSVPTTESLIDISKKNAGKTIEIIYSRAGIEHSVNVTLRNDTKEVLGAGLGQRQLIRATWSAPIVGIGTTVQFTWATIQGLGDIVYNLVNGLVMQLSQNSSVRQQASSELKSVSDSVAGPIGILGTIFPAASQAGPITIVFLTAIISISLAVMNILPIPALDGGRWLTMASFKLFKKELTKEREEQIQTIGFSIIMCLVILVTIADVAKLF